MECPNCKKTINEVNIFSLFQQTGFLKRNRIIHKTNPEFIENENIECPLCMEDITSYLDFGFPKE